MQCLVVFGVVLVGIVVMVVWARAICRQPLGRMRIKHVDGSIVYVSYPTGGMHIDWSDVVEAKVE
jgi:hypothetical protein